MAEYNLASLILPEKTVSFEFPDLKPSVSEDSPGGVLHNNGAGRDPDGSKRQ